MASPLVLKVNSPSLKKCHMKDVVAPSEWAYIEYLDGVMDDGFYDEMENGDTKKYIQTTYGEGSELRVLVFHKDLPRTSKCVQLRNLFPGVKLVLVTMDIHCCVNTRAQSVQDCDGLISMTYPFLFRRFYDIDVTSKLLHWGNRCSDEFIRSEPNFGSEDALFYFGADYTIRKSFLANADAHWKVIRHPRSRPSDTASELYKYTYAFTTGYDYCTSPNKSLIYYLVAKFFEIAGSGCLLLCDHRGVQLQLKEFGFVEGQHYLNINRQISSQVSAFVKNHPEKVREIRTRAHTLVTSKYTIKIACDQINQKLRSIS